MALGDHGGQAPDAPARRLVNDALPADEWERFCRAWAASLTANVAGALYVCMSSKEWPLVARVLAEAGAHWSDTIIWAKDRFTLGRADYQRQYEPVWYGWPDGSQRHWQGRRDQGDVWQIPRPAASPLHPTQKPLALVERAIENSSTPGATVLDPFCGAGTTLIACERTGRRGVGVEIDPRYVAATIARWEAFTGRGRRAPGTEGGDRWLADTPAGPSKGTAGPAGRRPCTRAAPASGTRPSPARTPPRRAGWGGCAAGARARSGAPTPWRGSARARICSASWSWRWRTPRATSGPSRARPPRRCTPPRSRWPWSSGRSRTPAPPGATVLDPFCGAGTTLIACERTGRRGVGVEIDPRYVAATIARWEAFTGAAAVPLEPGEATDA